MTNDKSKSDAMTQNDTERLDETPRDVLRELVGILSDHQLDREPPVSHEEIGECAGLDLAIDEINHIIENGDVRPPNTDPGQS